MKHREQIASGLVPRTLEPQSRQTLVTFDSKTRAQRLAKRLESDMEGATIIVERLGRLHREYAVILEVGKAGLTVRDHVTLTNLGWAQ